MNAIEILHKSARSARWLGIASLILGSLSLLAPFAAGLSIALTIGILIVVSGVAQLSLVFQARSFGRGTLLFLLALLNVFAGLAMVIQPAVALATLTLLLAGYFVANGLLESALAFQARPQRGWGWLAVSAVFAFLLGVMIGMQFPLSGTWAVGVLVGVRLLSTGGLLLGVGVAGAKSAVGSESAAKLARQGT